MEVLNPMFDTAPELRRLFTGGFSGKGLLGPELYEKMTGIRSRIQSDRGQHVGIRMEDSGDTVTSAGSR